MELQFDENGNVALSENKEPIYINDKGETIALDAGKLFASVSTESHKAGNFRKANQELRAKLEDFSAFEGLDPDEARKAIETIKNLEGEKLVEAEKVNEIRQTAIKAIEDKYAPVVEENAMLKRQLNNELIGNRFATSPYIEKKVIMHIEHLRSHFGKYFSVNDKGEIVAKDQDGFEILAPGNANKSASFDEAIEHLINADPGKDSILKGVNQDGTGITPGSSQTTGSKTFKEMSGGERVKLKQSNPDEFRRLMNAANG